MKTFMIAYGTSALTMLALDSVWLTLTSQRLYRAQLGELMRPGFDLPPAAVFYLLYLVGIVVFAVQPALAQQSWGVALRLGALLGLVAYATYDLTNQATLRGWPVAITIADLCWGTFLTATAATAGYFAARHFGAQAG